MSWSWLMFHSSFMSHPTTQNLTCPVPTTKTPRSPKTGTIKMSKLRDDPMLILYLALLFILAHFSICNGASILDLNALKGSEIDVKVGDCLSEPEMDSEISRRVLAMQKKYISYETLKRDLVPCARPGASYYNCHAVAANPYNRGCDVITRCRGTHDIKTWEREVAIPFSFIFLLYLMWVFGYECIFETHLLKSILMFTGMNLERSRVYMNLRLVLLTWILGIFFRFFEILQELIDDYMSSFVKRFLGVFLFLSS